MVVHATHAQDIGHIVHVPFTCLYYNRRWRSPLKPCTLWGLVCVPQNWNKGNCVMTQENFKPVWFISSFLDTILIPCSLQFNDPFYIPTLINNKNFTWYLWQVFWNIFYKLAYFLCWGGNFHLILITPHICPWNFIQR